MIPVLRPSYTQAEEDAVAEIEQPLLGSVWYNDDQALLERIIPFYARGSTRTIVDCTANTRRFWRGSSISPICLDINHSVSPDVVCTNQAMPLSDGSVDVLVYDPPHITDHDTPGSSKLWVESFGLRGSGDNISGEFRSFVREAKRVLRSDGILLAKLTDSIHNHRFQWVTIDFVQALREAGMTACDCIVKVRKNSMMSSKWQKMTHARRFHCYWIVARNSRRCE